MMPMQSAEKKEWAHLVLELPTLTSVPAERRLFYHLAEPTHLGGLLLVKLI